MQLAQPARILTIAAVKHAELGGADAIGAARDIQASAQECVVGAATEKEGMRQAG